MRIFISGPMTGYPKYNFPEFDAWEKRLVEAGHEVVNPAHISRSYKKEEVLNHGEKFREMQQRQLDALKTCDAIFLLNGWEKSVGAKLELKAALEQNCEVVMQSEYDGVLKRNCSRFANNDEAMDAFEAEHPEWISSDHPWKTTRFYENWLFTKCDQNKVVSEDMSICVPNQ